jgi:CTP synthase
MNPTEHGEVFVLDDGMECDQDMGNYERFLDRDLTGANYMTTGSIYLDGHPARAEHGLRRKIGERGAAHPNGSDRSHRPRGRNGKGGRRDWEVGGTVGEYENILFFEAIRMLRSSNIRKMFCLVLVSHLPIMSDDNELKTKPTQQAVRALNAHGLATGYHSGAREVSAR